MSPPLPRPFEALPWPTAPLEAGMRFAQRGLDRARAIHRRGKRLKEGVDSLMGVTRLGEGRLPLEEGLPP